MAKAPNRRPAGPAKRFLDIEVALQLAYRDELPKRGPRGGRWANTDFPTTSSMFRATVVDVGYTDRDPHLPAASGDPHPDALVIEKAVRDLASWSGHRFAEDVMAALVAGIPLAFDPVPIAAEAIAAMPGAMTIHARIGARPKWSRETPMPFPDTGGNGKPRVLIDETFVEVWDGRRVLQVPVRDPQPGEVAHVATVPCPPTRKDVYREHAYCPIKWRPDPAKLLQERAEYYAWRAALEILAGELEGRLTAIAVLPPAAPWFPWRGDHDLHGRPGQPFAALREELHRYLTKEQQAEQRRRAMRRTVAARGADAPPPQPPAGRVGKRDNGPA